MEPQSTKGYNFKLFGQFNGMLYLLDSVEYDSEFGEFRYQGQVEKLSAMGTKVFNYFLQNPSQLVSYDQLMADVWQRVVSENAVLQIITQIRQSYKKINPENEIIKNFRGKGFQLNPNTPIRSVALSQPRKKQLFSVMVIAFLLVSFVVYWLVKPAEEAIALGSERMVIVAAKHDETSEFDLNQASEALLNQWFKLSNNHDLVNIERYRDWDKKQQLVESLWRTNHQLKVITTELVHDNGQYHLNLKQTSVAGDKQSREFTAFTLHEVLQQGALWVSSQNTTNQLHNWLPVDGYLLETYLRGLTAMYQGDHLNAIDFFQLCLREHSDFHLARLGLANALNRQGQFDASVAELRVLQTIPAYELLAMPVDNELAAIELRRGQPQKGLALYQAMVKKYPLSAKSFVIHMNLAIADYMLGNYQQSLAQLMYLNQQLDPQIYPGYAAIIQFTIAGIHLYQQELEQVEPYLQESLRLFKQINDQQRIGSVYGRMVYFYAMKGDHQLAEQAVNNQYQIATSLGNQRSQMSVYNNMVMLKVSMGLFDEALVLNSQLNTLGTELGSLVSQAHAAQWRAMVALATGQLAQAAVDVEAFYQLALTEGSAPYKNGATVLKLDLALQNKEWDDAKQLVAELDKMADNAATQTEYVPLKAAYLAQTEGAERAVNYLLQAKEDAANYSDDAFMQKLDVLLAKQFLVVAPEKAIGLLRDLAVNDNYAFPYHWVYAQALYAQQKNVEALVQLQHAQQKYNQRWTREMQDLMNQVKNRLN